MSRAQRRIRVPATARRGEVITVRTLARHPMEPGVRFDVDNLLVYPRHIIQELLCFYNGRQVFRAEWFSAVSENPYFTFPLKAEESGTIEIVWIDDFGITSRASADITVTAAE